MQRAVLAIPFVLVAASACGRRSSPERRPGGAEASPAPVDRSDGTVPELRAAKVPAGSIAIDGRIDEPAWRATGTTGGFVNPGSGRPEPGSRVNAAAWLAWDDATLYVAVRVEDPDPAAPFDPAEVDPHVWEGSSGIELMLQPGDFGDNRGYYEVQVDTAGALWSTSFDDYNRPITGDGPARRFGRQDWEPAIERAAVVDRPEGWYSVELALPWSAVASARTAVPPHPGDVWRANLYSFRDGQADSLGWSPILGEGNFHRSSRFGRVVFEAEREGPHVDE